MRQRRALRRPFVYDHGLTDKTSFTLETGGGIRPITLHLEAGRVQSVTVDMGAPQALEKREGYVYVSMGNPHAVHLVPFDPFAWEAFEREGARLCSTLGMNIEFTKVLSREALQMRVYERGERRNARVRFRSVRQRGGSDGAGPLQPKRNGKAARRYAID